MGGAFASCVCLPIQGRIQKARLECKGWVGKGVRGAKSVEADMPKASRSEASKPPSRDAESVKGIGKGEGISKTISDAMMGSMEVE